MPNHSGRKSLVIRLNNQQNRIRLPISRLRAIGRLILGSLGLKRAEASFLFVTDRRMKYLNRKFKRKNRPTDVRSFSQLEERQIPDLSRRCLLGDVIISVDTTKRQAPLYGNSFLKELVLYMIHGILHILGFDDQRPRSRKIMRRKEEEIMIKIEKQFSFLSQ